MLKPDKGQIGPLKIKSIRAVADKARIPPGTACTSESSGATDKPPC